MNPLFWSLLAGIVFCALAWMIGPNRATRCHDCKGRGFIYRTASDGPIEIESIASCPNGCEAP